MFEFDAILKKQKDAGFRAAGEKAAVRFKPMLAHKFKDSRHHAVWPSFVQPKLNGVRMLMDGKSAWTRGGKDHIPEVVKHLMFDTGGHVLDGELMMPNNLLLQDSMTAIKKFRPDRSPQLLYHVYDVVEPGMPYAQRLELVKKLLKNAPPNVRMVQTDVCKTADDVMGFHKLFTSQGYEGAMLRNPNTGYEDGKRSYSLLKVKTFLDSEFRIVDVVEGGGADAGHAIFVCSTSAGKRFNCRPEGSKVNRAEQFKNRKSLIGKFLTIRFFELSADDIPLFPVGVVVRDAQD
jgi:DNA ligase-1